MAAHTTIGGVCLYLQKKDRLTLHEKQEKNRLSVFVNK